MDKPVEELRILMLEDEPTDAELAQNALREAGLSFAAKVVHSRETFVRALEEFKPDIVLADYKLPAFDGVSAVKMVREKHPTVPVVMVTGVVGDEKAVELLKLGAKDYILKDRLARLAPAVQRALSAEQGIRARKAAEKALQQSEEQFRSVFENARDVILALSTDGILVMLNPAFEQITGWKCTDWLGKAFPPLVHPDDLPKALDLFQRAVQGEPLPVFELRVLTKDRNYVVGELTVDPIVHQGDQAYLIATVRDVTERKQAEEKLRLHSEILSNLSEGIVLTRARDGVIVFTNPQFERMFGYESGGLLNKHVSTVNAPGEKGPEAVATAIMSELAQTGRWRGEVRNVKKDGTAFWCYASSSAFDHPEYGKVWVSIHEDITERKQAEARIQKLTKLYATLSQTNEIIVRATDRKELLCSICGAAVDHGKFALAWWGLADEKTRMIQSICHRGDDDGYLADIVISIDDIPEGRGPTGTSIRENRVSYVNDYATDERVIPWREAALKRGFRGSAGIPLRFRGKATGALTLYVKEPDFFDTDQLQLLEEMATDIGYALDNFAREAERKQAESKLAEQLNELRRWHDATLGREMRILDLKHEVNELLVQAGKPPRYHSTE